MTTNDEPTPSSNTILKTVVVVLIVWVAYWVATGGYQEITVPDTAPAEASSGD